MRRFRPTTAVYPYSIYKQAGTHHVARRNTAVSFWKGLCVLPNKCIGFGWTADGDSVVGDSQDQGAECGQLCHWTWRLTDTIQKALLYRNYLYRIPLLWVHSNTSITATWEMNLTKDTDRSNWEMYRDREAGRIRLNINTRRPALTQNCAKFTEYSLVM
jgi:hypothetical protein